MEIRKITEEEWSKLPVFKASGPIETLTEELEYYAGPQNDVLGIVLMDNVDRDFSHVVLMRHGQKGDYRGVDLGVSAPTLDIAKTKLHEKMRQLIKNGEPYVQDGLSVAEVHPKMLEAINSIAEEWNTQRTKRVRRQGN